ncbi:sulfite reductase subunit alpha [Rothia sp. (in: high G+C Gram-positive bacteria)]|uniref:sulfite reductase subunit alpha n=1 Tax=Rothia sp. (in: high G+C Gram-positive bacteria) TaxID=1885016 RepID=UPI001CAFFD7C|nr:sulfite reductase subunit alpha [Rothia sp. (in: high G+C Gram-positive bacteria)]MBF1655955.1 sulfite reductase subunit alpha [Rothia sp. (in: high G+C Gram-positive bacteria)]
MSEATGSKPYSEDEAYLYETYVTEDGIEVPPPTKVMGPRRLARYREEVAEYLRANRRGEHPKPVENMGSVIHAGAIDPQVLAVQRRFAALAAQGKIDTEANDEEKLHEPAPLTSSLRILRPEEIAQNRVDATSPSAVDNPMTSSIPVIAVVKEEKPEPELHQYLVRDEPKVEELDSSDVEAEQTEVASVEEETVEVAEVEESADELPTRVSAVNAQGLDLSVLDSASAGDTVDSVDGDPTVALSPDEVEELLQRMVDRQDPEESAALVEEVTEEAEESEEAAKDAESKVADSKVAKSKSAPVPSAEASKESASKGAVEKTEEVLQPAQKASLAWLWIVLLLALVVVGLIMIFGPK